MLGGIGWQEFAIVLVILTFPVLVALALLAARGGRPFVLNQWVPLPPPTIAAHPQAWYARDGWVPAANQPGSLAFTRRAPPDTGLAVLLFFFGVVPGLLYLLLGGRDQATTLLLQPRPDGSTLEIIVASAGSGGRPSAERFFNSLHALV